VIVVTLVTAGRIFSGGFPSGHFTHVFIDEAGHAVEPEALIAISGNNTYCRVSNLFVPASPLTSIESPHWYKCT
jgi:hypothetical protein